VKMYRHDVFSTYLALLRISDQCLRRESRQKLLLRIQFPRSLELEKGGEARDYPVPSLSKPCPVNLCDFSSSLSPIESM
jgi:hypothetical protein